MKSQPGKPECPRTAQHRFRTEVSFWIGYRAKFPRNRHLRVLGRFEFWREHSGRCRVCAVGRSAVSRLRVLLDYLQSIPTAATAIAKLLAPAY